MVEKLDDIEIRLLLDAIFRKYHYDFRGYAMASIKRCLKQAREFFNCATFSLLQDRVLHEPAMLPKLLSYLTVQVSELFRDPAYFRAIRELVVPYLRTYPSLKIWVAGCSTGEELYSLVILFREEGLEDRTIFYATDINPDALKRAEAGVYELDRIPLFTENHRQSGGRSSLSDYYTAAYGAAVLDKSLRKRTVFSDHSLVTDSVFAEMQMISCRNVLIYFDREFQDRAVGVFASSLIHKGFLGIGAKESLRFSRHSDEFTDFSRDVRIYQRRGAVSAVRLLRQSLLARRPVLSMRSPRSCRSYPRITRCRFSWSFTFRLTRRVCLPKLLNARCNVEIREAEDKEPIRESVVYFAPPIITCWWKRTNVFLCPTKRRCISRDRRSTCCSNRLPTRLARRWWAQC